jgi:predicted TIM-barrel fold metal-dependent hydrolase
MTQNGTSRRNFLQSVLTLAAVSRLGAQAPAAPDWGGPVLDVHLHLRQTADGNFNHLEGSGVAKALLLTNVNAEAHAKEVAAAYPGRFARSASVDVTMPDAVDRLRMAIKDGAISLAEIKSQVEAAGPEMQRLYALAAELDVPITIHFQEISQPGSQGTYNRGLKKFDAMLKAFPKTKFVGHADAFWANVSADYAENTAYPTGPIKPGGVTDRFLTEYANLYADMSANSCNNFLNRDPDFAAGFLVRHQDKLMFGSDCGCLDGRGGGTGRCIARETLSALKKLAPADVFRKITWQNGTRLLRL